MIIMVKTPVQSLPRLWLSGAHRLPDVFRCEHSGVMASLLSLIMHVKCVSLKPQTFSVFSHWTCVPTFCYVNIAKKLITSLFLVSDTLNPNQFLLPFSHSPSWSDFFFCMVSPHFVYWFILLLFTTHSHIPITGIYFWFLRILVKKRTNKTDTEISHF